MVGFSDSAATYYLIRITFQSMFVVFLDVSIPCVAHSCRIFMDEVFVLTVTIPTGFS